MSERLFKIELAYQNLRDTLKLSSSSNFKILNISKFLSLIIPADDSSKYYSYYSETERVLTELILKNDFIFISPEDITTLKNQLEYLSNLFVFSQKQNEFDSLISHLEKIQIEKTSADYKNKSAVEHKTYSLPVVLIEGNNKVSDGLKTAVVYNLHISSSIRPKGEHTDRVELKNMIDISDTEILDHLNNIVKTAKSEYQSEYKKEGYYNFTFWFDEKENVYTGSSLGIGAICLAYNSILINELNKYYFKFRSDVVFTGELDTDGNLVKMDSEILKIKLTSVFFSQYKKIIIPEDNINEAKDFVNDLKRKFPQTEINLIPLKNFNSVFNNLDVVERYELKPFQKAGALINRHQKKVNYTLSVLSLLIVLFFGYKIVLPMFDDNPVIKKYDNDRLAAYNKYDKKLWESDFVLNIANEKSKVHQQAITNNMILSDLDEDGKNEILAINTSSPDTIVNRTIFCYKNDGSLKWKFTAPAHYIEYRGNKFDDNFMYSLLVSSDFKINGHKYLVSSGNIKQFFPCELAVHSPDGSVIASYWHSGTLIQIKILDMDSDGREEIYASGVNNKPRTSCLAVFDPLIIKGSSYQTDPLKDGVKGTEKFYILFPRTFFSSLSPEGYGYAFSIYQKSPVRLIIEVVEAVNGNPYDDLNPIVLYEFDEKMNILNAILSSSFSSRYEEMKSDTTKKLPVINNWSQYQDSLKNAVQYWDGAKFVNQPVMNRYYLLAKDSLNHSK